MNANVNIEEVKKYNATLKQYKDSAAQLQAQKDYISKDIDAKCAELSRDLGVTVTRDNLEQVCEDLCNKINSTLKSGNAILEKIAQESAKANAVAQGQVVGQTGTSSVNAQPAQFNAQAPVAPTLPPMNNGVPPMMNNQATVVGDDGVAVDGSIPDSMISNFANGPLPVLFG